MKKFLSKYDGLWALPLSFFAFVFAGFLLQKIGGYDTGSYDIAFIQPLFLAIAIVIGIANASVWGLYFIFRDMHKWLYGVSGRSSWRIMPTLVKTIISLIVFFIFFLSILLVFKSLV